MKNIVLTGFMAAGKTQISKALAKLTGLQCLDTDELIVQREGQSVNDIFRQIGEEGFREIESEIIDAAASNSGVIISTGGGSVLRERNRKTLRQTGIIFNLEPDSETIRKRLEQARATRPLLKHDNIDEVLARFEGRKPFYDDCDVKIHVSNEKEPADFAKEIWDIYRKMTADTNF